MTNQHFCVRTNTICIILRYYIQIDVTELLHKFNASVIPQYSYVFRSLSQSNITDRPIIYNGALDTGGRLSVDEGKGGVTRTTLWNFDWRCSVASTWRRRCVCSVSQFGCRCSTERSRSSASRRQCRTNPRNSDDIGIRRIRPVTVRPRRLPRFLPPSTHDSYRGRARSRSVSGLSRDSAPMTSANIRRTVTSEWHNFVVKAQGAYTHLYMQLKARFTNK